MTALVSFDNQENRATAGGGGGGTNCNKIHFSARIDL